MNDYVPAPLPPYLYGSECGPLERVWTERDTLAYTRAEVERHTAALRGEVEKERKRYRELFAAYHALCVHAAAPQPPVAVPANPTRAGALKEACRVATALRVTADLSQADRDYAANIIDKLALWAEAAPQPARPVGLADEQVDVCTDPENCRRCKAPSRDKHRFTHAGIQPPSGEGKTT